jgi:hypothetical protein
VASLLWMVVEIERGYRNRGLERSTTLLIAQINVCCRQSAGQKSWQAASMEQNAYLDLLCSWGRRGRNPSCFNRLLSRTDIVKEPMGVARRGLNAGMTEQPPRSFEVPGRPHIWRPSRVACVVPAEAFGDADIPNIPAPVRLNPLSVIGRRSPLTRPLGCTRPCR